MTKLFLTQAQTECLLNFAKEVAKPGELAVGHVRYGLIGSEDLMGQKKSARLLAALQSQDWESASAHNALAGNNDLLLGIGLLLKTNAGGSSAHWVAMRSPFELMDWPAIVAAGKVDELPSMTLEVLF